MKEFKVGDKVVFAVDDNTVCEGVVVDIRAGILDYYLEIKTRNGKFYSRYINEVYKMQDPTFHQIVKWFKDAIPNYTAEDLCFQYGCHVEQFIESLDALGCDIEHRLKFRYIEYQFKSKYGDALRSTVNCLEFIPDKIDLINAMCDQIVTAIGVLYMLGVDPEQVLQEVVRSNDSKRNPETGEFDRDANGRIVKGENYERPNLEKFCRSGMIEG